MSSTLLSVSPALAVAMVVLVARVMSGGARPFVTTGHRGIGRGSAQASR